MECDVGAMRLCVYVHVSLLLAHLCCSLLCAAHGGAGGGTVLDAGCYGRCRHQVLRVHVYDATPRVCMLWAACVYM